MHHEKSLVSVFQEFSASIIKNVILQLRLGTRIPFPEVYTLFSCLVISRDPKPSVVWQVLTHLVDTRFQTNSC